VIAKPVSTLLQFVPLLVERKTPPQVPAKRFVEPATPEAGETARALTVRSVKPVLTAFQLAPLSVERKTPVRSVPAKRFVPETIRDITSVFGKPVFVAVQLVPLLVERNTPPKVPANRLVPEIARA